MCVGWGSEGVWRHGGRCQPGPFRARNPMAILTRSFASEVLARSGLLNGVSPAPVVV